MNVEVEESGPVERRLRVEVPIAEVDAAFDRAYRKLQKGSRVRGFRPGKTPRSVLERYFGEQAQSEVFEAVVRDSLGRALEETALPIVAEPRLNPDGLPKQGSPFCYEATVEIRPEIELQKTRGLEVSSPLLPEPENDPVEAHLEELRHAHATLADAEEGAQAAQGHVAIVHYAGTLDGEAFPGGEGRDVEFEIGSGRSLPGFEDALIGMSVGEEREFDVDVPEEDTRSQLAGKRIHFRVELAALKRRELADLDDEFAKDVSDFETMEALRADLRAKVEEGREAERKRVLREAAVDAVIAANPFPVPSTLVDQQLSARVSRAVQQLRGRIPDETLREMLARWQEEWRPAAERDVRMSFLVDAIAEGEGLSVSDEDYDAQLRRLAEGSGRSLAQVQREYREAGVTEAIRRRLLEDRVIDFVLAEATVSESPSRETEA